MASLEDIEHFLREFKYKSGFYGVTIETTRLKNLQTMATLELSQRQILRILNEIRPTDYSSGPTEDVLKSGPPLWVFGCEVKGHEVYIKITMGNPNDNTVCVSFHISERPMNYPYKT